MKIKDLIADHNLDVRFYDQEYGWGVCPACMQPGTLKIDVKRNVFECHSCHERGDAYKLDALVRKVRHREILH